LSAENWIGLIGGVLLTIYLFAARMIALVEGAKRQKTPNEIALNILLASLTIIFMLAVITLQPMAYYAKAPQSLVTRVALLVALIPTTIGIAGMDRLVQRNVLAMSGRAVEAAGDVNTLLLDKTGTITIGNRQASEFLPAGGASATELAGAARLSSMADYTPEGRSVVILAKAEYGLRERSEGELAGAEFIEFTAQTRMSGGWTSPTGGSAGGGNQEGRVGVGPAVNPRERGTVPSDLGPVVDRISAAGGTPLVVAEQPAGGGPARALGVIYLKDIVKEGIAERFAELRTMGIRTVMITGDNPLTAKAIADESGVDDFLAEATPEDKMALIVREQLPAMCSVAFPALNKLNILHLHSPASAITSAIVFNALIIVALIPLALRGVRYRPASAQSLLRRNLWIYGLGGLIIPFIGIKAIDLIVMNIPGFN
jgi:potassium-transporting ATPase ATP-binding subunit